MLRAIEDPVELANLLCAQGRANVAAGDTGQTRLVLAEILQIAARIAPHQTPASGAKSPSCVRRWTEPTRAARKRAVILRRLPVPSYTVKHWHCRH